MKNIDTGMGLERLAAVMQHAANNFETDLFLPLIKEITGLTKTPGNAGQKKMIYAIADHIRAVTFSLYDGVLPSNEERGYVLRKLIRRSIMHGRKLGIKHAFLYQLVPVVAQIMKHPYPDLETRKENIAEIILAEEKNFNATLNTSQALFKEKFKPFIAHPDPQKSGHVCFMLYDTYGIPLELTQNG